MLLFFCVVKSKAHPDTRVIFGKGQIAKGVTLAALLGEDTQAMIDRVIAGENLNQIARENDIRPNELALGRVIGGTMDDEDDEVDKEDDSECTTANQGPVVEGEENKFGCEGRGNSCNTGNNRNGNHGGNGHN